MLSAENAPFIIPRFSSLAWLAAAALVVMTLMLPILQIAVVDSADYRDHIRDARLWAEAGAGLQNANRPHFLFHLLTIGAHTLIADWNNAAIAVITLMAGFTTVLILLPLRRAFGAVRWQDNALVVIGAILLMLIAPITMLTWSSQNLYFVYIPSHIYHNPTQNVLKPFALLFFFAALLVFQQPSSAQPKMRRLAVVALAFVVGLCATLAKPSFSICLLPALGAVVLYRLYRRQPVDWVLLIFGIGAPVALVLGWQYLFHRSGMGGFAFDPLRVVEHYSAGTWHWKFLLSIPFPLAVYLLYWREARKRLDLNLAWLTFSAASVYLYLLSEPRDWTSANFWWSAQIALFVLMVISAIFFVRQIRAQPRWTWQAVVCALLFATHVVCGIVWYAAQFASPDMYAWW
jgi:hypothetical protein